MLGKSRSGRIPFCTKISRCQFCNPFFLFFLFWQEFGQEFGRAFFLLEKRSLVEFSIRKVRGREFVRARRGQGVFFYTEIVDLCGLGFIYTEFAGRLRVRRMARIWMVAPRLGFSVHRDRGFVEIGLYLHRDCRCIGRCGTRSEMTLLFSSQMQTKFRRRFRVVFS